MRYKYAFLNNENIVYKLVDTPIKNTDNNTIDIESLDSSLLNATYNHETNEFIKVAKTTENEEI